MGSNYLGINDEQHQRLLESLGVIFNSYEVVVSSLIRERYSIDDEFAFHRQRETKPEEFKEYNDFVEQCKTKAKEIWAKQEDAISKLSI